MGATDSKPTDSNHHHDPRSSFFSFRKKKNQEQGVSQNCVQQVISGPSSRTSANVPPSPSPYRNVREVGSVQGTSEFPLSDPLPLHVDSQSVVYASSAFLSPLVDDFPEQQQLPTGYFYADNSEIEEEALLAEPLLSDSLPLLDDFSMAPPVVPLLDSSILGCAHLDSEGMEGIKKLLPRFLATPQYASGSKGKNEEVLCHSPVLLSYHEKSFPVVAPDNSEGSTVVSSSRTTNMKDSATMTQTIANNSSNSCTTVASSLQKSISATTMMASSAQGISDCVANSSPHRRFLDISGNPIGLENYGNTCYVNSVVQLIYHCTPFRLRILELFDAYKARRGSSGFKENTVLYSFCSLMSDLHKANNLKSREGEKMIPTRNFLLRIAGKNSLFKNEQQDAHEFCMFLLNELIETEQSIMKIPKNAKYFRQLQDQENSKFRMLLNSSKLSAEAKNFRQRAISDDESNEKTLFPLQSILQGSFVSTTACLNCGSITYRKDAFLDLSFETRPGCSLLDCLAHFGDPSLFIGNNQLKCTKCDALANAANTIHVEELPQFALLIHLKRFRYNPSKGTFSKTSHHVPLPMEMDVEEYRMEIPSEDVPGRPENYGEKTNAALQKGVVPPPTQETFPIPVLSSLPVAEMAHASTTSSGVSKPASLVVPAPPALAPFRGIPPDIRAKLEGVVERKARFELTGFVAHLGEGPSLGHYFTCTRYGPNLWRRFDDGVVSTMSRREVEQLFGVPLEVPGMVTTTAYILLYERVA